VVSGWSKAGLLAGLAVLFAGGLVMGRRRE
jgi:hypothetical protein